MAKISVTRGLAELKRLDSRISQAISSGLFVSVVTGTGTNASVKHHQPSKTIDEVKYAIQGSFDQVNQLIKNRQKLKSAIILSNATTKITLGGTELTVAEAIDLKSTVDAKEKFLTVLMSQSATAKNLVESWNAKMEAAIDASLTTIYSNDKGKVDASMYAAIAGPQRAQKEASLFDPGHIDGAIASLRIEIEKIKTEIDFLLSESNSTTMIEYDTLS